MTLIFLLLIALFLFAYAKRNKTCYILFFILSTFFCVLIKINPDLNEKYNLRQILYLVDNFNFTIFIIVSILIITLLIFIVFDRTKKKNSRILYSFISTLGAFFILLIILAINIFIVKEPLKNHFEGYVFDKEKKPLVGVKVIDGKSSNNYVLTDEKGFFKMKKKEDINNESNLVFIKNGYKDSIVVIKINSYHPPSSHFLFLRTEFDTIRMAVDERTKLIQ
jgi:hypothetical protein